MASSFRFIKQSCSRTFCQNFMFSPSSPNFQYLSPSIRQLSCSALLFNGQRRYAEKHEWIVLNGNIGTVGITNYAQDSLGDVVYVQLPEVGAEVEADAEVGVIESVKAVSELYSPVSGQITEVNAELETKPTLLNTDCYDKGWTYKLEVKNPADVDELMTEQEYEKYLKAME